ncbi:hypothetical protein, partial [Xanthomonas vasicola]
LIDALVQVHWLPDDSAAALHQAHAALVDAGLSCTLDRRPRLIAPTPAIQQARGIIFNAARVQGLTFPLGKDETAL